MDRVWISCIRIIPTCVRYDICPHYQAKLIPSEAMRCTHTHYTRVWMYTTGRIWNASFRSSNGLHGWKISTDSKTNDSYEREEKLQTKRIQRANSLDCIAARRHSLRSPKTASHNLFCCSFSDLCEEYTRSIFFLANEQLLGGRLSSSFSGMQYIPFLCGL